MKSFILFFVGILLLSCSSVYKTSEFRLSSSPTEPDYNNQENWAVLPNLWNQSLEEIVGKPEEKKADVFYVYPTLLTDKKDASWNADIYDKDTRSNVLDKAVSYQASAWVKAANLYVPYYRQAHYRIFFEPYSEQGKDSGLMAYQDIRNAFKYY